MCLHSLISIRASIFSVWENGRFPWRTCRKIFTQTMKVFVVDEMRDFVLCRANSRVRRSQHDDLFTSVSVLVARWQLRNALLFLCRHSFWQGEEESEHFLVLSCWRMALIFWVIMHLRNLYKSPSFSPLGGVKRLGVPRCQPALIYARGDGFQPVSFHTRNHVSLIKKQFSNTWDNHVNAFFRLI